MERATGRIEYAQEAEGLSRASIVITLLGVLIFSALLVAAGAIMLDQRRRALEPSAARVARQPAIAVEVSQVQSELFGETGRSGPARSRAQQLARLQRYGWVDRAHGIVHLPIDVAITVLLERQH